MTSIIVGGCEVRLISVTPLPRHPSTLPSRNGVDAERFPGLARLVAEWSTLPKERVAD